MSNNAKRPVRLGIIGAGPGGMCMAIQLKRAGFHDFAILEKSGGIGGTWNHNRYPGCACDIQSQLYSFSFEMKRDWSRPYAPQPEILAYLEMCAEKYDLLPHCRFNDGVHRATWNEETAQWTLALESGEEFVCDVVISAIGMFNELNYPEIEGLDTFAGTSFHSARWNEEHDLSGESVGVIGSAASAVQFVPEIAKQAGDVYLFQRTPNWVLPKEDDPYTEEQLEYFRSHPEVVQKIRDDIFTMIDSGGPGTFGAIRSDMEAACLANIDKVDDPDLRAKLVPDHPWACKRPLFSNDYYPAFNRPNLHLVTEGIECVKPHSIRTRDGEERAIDTLILATGFSATKFLSLIDVVGRDGITIEEAWSDGAQAYKGVMTAGFPNLFMLYGPNTNGDSIITTIEYEVDHAVRHICRLAEEDLAWIDVRSEPMAQYNTKMQEDIAAVEPWQAGCSDYYRAPSGRVVTQWPHTMSELKGLLDKADEESYEVARR